MANKKQAKDIISAPTHLTIDAEQLDKVLAKMQAPEMVVTSAKLHNGTCRYSYAMRTETGAHNTIKVTSDAAYHPDMGKAFSKLYAHLAVICEDVASKSVKNIEMGIGAFQEVTNKLQTYQVDEIAIMNNGEGVVLKGLKILTTGDSVGLVTPIVNWSADYFFVNELKIAVDDIIEEVTAYHHGKVDPGPQLDLFEENN